MESISATMGGRGYIPGHKSDGCAHMYTNSVGYIQPKTQTCTDNEFMLCSLIRRNRPLELTRTLYHSSLSIFSQYLAEKLGP